MKLNELLGQGVTLYSVAEVIEITEPEEGSPYGREVKLWEPPEPTDLFAPVTWSWADREIVSIWPIQDTRYPLLQIEVRQERLI